ncbi:MAG: DUF561 domain-containing protein [Candidatus Sericytochromatia bacterium]
MMKKYQLKKLLEEKRLFKLIAGMENFNQENVRMVVNSATLGKANAIDISADSENIDWVKENHTGLIVFVSSLSIHMLAVAKDWGADVLELGNFDALYARGKSISSEEVINLTRELRAIAGNTPICISIPGNMSINDQVSLAVQVQAAGADMLQIENLSYESDYDNAKEISKSVEIPVILSGKLDASKVEKAMSTGVNGIGIGNAVNKKETLPEMVEEVKAIMKNLEVKVAV